MKKIQWISTAAVLGIAACHPVGPDYQGPPKLGHSKHFRGGNNSPAKLDNWWQQLGNSELNQLVTRALDNNHDIAIAGQRLREARALRKHAASAVLPHAGAHAAYTHTNMQSMPGLQPFSGIVGENLLGSPLKYWGAGLDVGWEVDVFGGSRRKIRGAAAREQAVAETLHATRLAIVSEVAETYFTIAGMREQLRTVNAQVKLQRLQVKDTRLRLQAGATSQLDVDRAETRLALIQAQIPTVEAGIIQQLRRLALLLGSQPDGLDRHKIGARPLPKRLPMVRTGLPAELILRRPDVRAAERELAAATEDTGVATSRFYPSFSIGGGPANVSRSAGNLFNPSEFFWQFSPQVRWNPFTAGANKAMLEAADARQKSAMLKYQQSALRAIGEVESEMAGLQAETRKLAIIQRALQSSRSATRIVKKNHAAGASDYVRVLMEEQRLQEIEISEIRVKLQMIQVWIRLHKALGGGWQT